MNDTATEQDIEVRLGVDGQRALHLRGRLGTATVTRLRAAALEVANQPSGHVVVECYEVEHLGGAALQVLVALQRDLGRKGTCAKVVGLGASLSAGLGAFGFTQDLQPR